MSDTNQKFLFSVPPLPIPKLEGLGSMYYKKMLQHKDKIAHTCIETGLTETYSSVLQKTIRTSLAMRSRGIKPNDIITICSHNSMDCLIPFYASFFIGAVSANIDPLLPQADIIYLLKLVCPKIIFVIPETIKLIQDAVKELNLVTEIIVFGESSNYTNFSEFLISHPEEHTFVPYQVTNLRDTAVIVFSSGSTGMTKGICLTHYGLSGLSYQLKYLDLCFGSSFLLYGNLYWISAVAFTSGCIRNGTNRLIAHKFDSRNIWNIIKEYKVGAMFLNSFHLLEMCKHGRPKDAETSALRIIVYGGAPTSGEQNAYFMSCFPGTVLLTGLGQTESSGTILTFDPTNAVDNEYMEKNPESVGKPIPGYICKVVDINTGESLGPLQEGELRIKSDFLMNGYYKMDSSDCWDSQEFFKTGDIVFYDKDNYFYVVGRVKDLLKYQMWHISPAKLELILLQHPDVHNCVVVGKPHETDGDHPVGVVQLKESSIGKVKEEELQKYVDDQVGNHQKLRGGIKFIEEFPLTVTGKINKMQIKRDILCGRL